MKRTYLMAAAGIAFSISAIVAFASLWAAPKRGEDPRHVGDPRKAAPLVKIAEAARPAGTDRAFTGVVAARVQSNLGFRVTGKIVERLVDVGQQVVAGQPLMRIDETDLRLAVTAKRNAVAATRAVVVQARADEARYAVLSKGGLAATAQRYEQAKAALDTAEAQLEAAQAAAGVAENEATYSVLVADAAGVIVDTLGEPGQVVAAGQTVVRLAQSGPREAAVMLPETVRPAIGSMAEANIYGDGARRWPARLRQISNAADAATRTYEARYVLDGDAASAPLGATATIRIANPASAGAVSVPVGAILDDGGRAGVWVLDRGTSRVRFTAVDVQRLGEETALVLGVAVGDPVVALGAHLLREGAAVRTRVEGGDK